MFFVVVYFQFAKCFFNIESFLTFLLVFLEGSVTQIMLENRNTDLRVALFTVAMVVGVQFS